MRFTWIAVLSPFTVAACIDRDPVIVNTPGNETSDAVVVPDTDDETVIIEEDDDEAVVVDPYDDDDTIVVDPD